MSRMTEPTYNQGFLRNTLELTSQYLTDILLTIQNFQYSIDQREYHTNHRLSQLSSEVGHFVELTTLLARLVTLKTNVTIPDIKESHLQLLFIFKAINQAQTKNDSTALEELIKYELKDNLTQWKILFIPQLKKLLNS